MSCQFAGVAQVVDQLIRNQQVVGSSPIFSSKAVFPRKEMPLFFFILLELNKPCVHYYILIKSKFQLQNEGTNQ